MDKYVIYDKVEIMDMDRKWVDKLMNKVIGFDKWIMNNYKKYHGKN